MIHGPAGRGANDSPVRESVRLASMKLVGPDRYKLSFDAQAFTVLCSKGTNRFSGLATCNKPKLYIASVGEQPVYVGVTRQPMRNRLRFGWNATGAGGYHGYAWRHPFKEANLDIWCDDGATDKQSLLEMETIEAEVVFLIRCAGQWPAFQTEIHFHPSNLIHRKLAADVIAKYQFQPGQPQC
jgi:hypothetical protein